MTESLKKIINQSITQLPKTKLVQSISQIGSQVFNKSFQIHSQSDDSVNNQELLKMEIKQLKRQNAFLKGKIQQLKKNQPMMKPTFLKRQSLNCMNILKKRAQSTQISQQNTVSFVLKQVQSILKSLASLYKIETDDRMWAIQQLGNMKQELQQKNIIALDKQYRQKMKKKLQMIQLSRQQTRYSQLLQVFTQYYKLKSQQQNRTKQKIQRYIQKTIDISKRLIQGANSRVYEKGIMKSSCIYGMSGSNNNLQTSISVSLLNRTVSTNGIGGMIYQYQKPKFGYNPQKHQLSYSTIDGHHHHLQQPQITTTLY